MRRDDDKVPSRDVFFLWCILTPNQFCNIPYCLAKYLAESGVKERSTSKICGGMFITKLARSYGILEGRIGNQLTMVSQPAFSPLLYRRAKIIVDFGGGHVNIPLVYDAELPEQPRKRVRPRPTHMQEDPPVIPINDELPMDPYNVEQRAFQDDLASNLNYGHRNLAHMMSHLNIPRMENEPEYPYVRSWSDRWSMRQSGAGGSGLGEEESEDED